MADSRALLRPSTRAKKFAPWEHVVGRFDSDVDEIAVVMPDSPDTLPHEVCVVYDHETRNVWVDRLRLATEVEMLKLARTTQSESGYGWTLDMVYPFFPGLPCVHCGKFVGRDGIFNVEHFEMSDTISSLDAEHRGCGR